MVGGLEGLMAKKTQECQHDNVESVTILDDDSRIGRCVDCNKTGRASWMERTASERVAKTARNVLNG